ncbi:MAG: hypothetical protein GF344_07550, partial [Chitinivibrionales bacterium]|nr:hypothetical protein [Chitinivibrionales bacterium]MBD3356753.1 hypothetical protein [Chitinivibrionales bacterium]
LSSQPKDDGLITWTPEESGDYEYYFDISDGYGSHRFGPLTKSVFPEGNPLPDSAYFLEGITESIPDTLHIGSDTLRLDAAIDQPISSGQYIVNVTLSPRDTANEDTLLLSSSQHTTVVWAPRRGDEGSYTLKLSVSSEGTAVTDSLSVNLEIAPKIDPPVVGFVNPEGFASEGMEQPYNIAIALSRPIAQSVSVELVAETSDNDADASDYSLPTPPAATFYPGDTTLFIPMTIIDDTLSENEESIRFRLLGDSPSVTYSEQAHSVRIIDNDTASDTTPLPELGFATARTRTDECNCIINIFVNLSSKTDDTVTARIIPRWEGFSDCELIDERIHILPQDSADTIGVLVLDDDICESDSEFFMLEITDPSGAVLGDYTGHTITVTPSDSSRCYRTILMITGTDMEISNDYDGIDDSIKKTFVSEGFTVKMVNENGFIASSGQHLKDVGMVFMSRSIRRDKVGEMLRDVSIPVICAAGEKGYANLGLVHIDSIGTSYKRKIDRIAGDKNEESKDSEEKKESVAVITILGSLHDIPWAKPAPSAKIIATIHDEPNHAAIFYFLKGRQLVGSNFDAPALRIGFPMVETDETSTVYTKDWWNMLIEIVKLASEGSKNRN